MRLQLVLLSLSFLLTQAFPAFSATLEARPAFKEGYNLLAEGKYYAAINSFKLTLNDYSYPLLDYSYYYIAQAYQKKHHVKEALQVYSIVLGDFKDSVLVPHSLFAMAQLQLEDRQPETAAKTLRDLIARFPTYEEVDQARYLLGSVLEQQGNYADAARVYRNLDLLHPSSDWSEKALIRLDHLAKSKHLAGYEVPAAAQYNLGVKYFDKKNYAGAKECFYRLTKFYKKSSFYDEALLMLGRIFLRNGKLDTAAKYFSQAINLDRDSKPEAMFYLALTYDYQNSPRASISLLEKIVASYPNSHSADDALSYLGRYYTQMNQTEQALLTYEKLATSYPNSELFPDIVWLIGNIYYKQGRYEEAYQNFARALELPADKVSDRLLFWAAKCAEKAGKTDKAIMAYKTTVARHDHSYYAYRAREELAKNGISLNPNAIPDLSEVISDLDGDSVETTSHERKYQELLALDLGDEAVEEAAFIEEKVPLIKKEKVSLAKYNAYVMKGKFAKPIWFADKKINDAMLSGSLAGIDPRLWRFSYPRGYWSYVEKYSKMYGLDPHLTYAVIREESRFKSQALSRSRAHGLMQIIPSTGRSISRDLGLSYSRWNMYDPRINIQMGTYYLAGLIRRFNGNISLALAGYNGGPVRVEKWLKKYQQFDLDEFVEDIPLWETRNYVKKVMKSYYGYKRTYSSDG
ncbi:MAG: transglycosylase SLT domain-containing protein [Candidatus Margulisbacteria bacterium]|nr:transglycosylase SLT domain-containing protein [Candidatus Margulisiibacteriota bacterium]